jgi:RNase adaptor protein for sRNA GlmZ degradation
MLKKIIVMSFGHNWEESIDSYVEAGRSGSKHHTLPVHQVFDCRHIFNPYWIKELRNRTGLDAEVVKMLNDNEEARNFIANTIRLVQAGIRQAAPKVATPEAYRVAYGCTGGHHRSVWAAEVCAAHLRRDPRGVEASVEVIHRELEKGR